MQRGKGNLWAICLSLESYWGDDWNTYDCALVVPLVVLLASTCPLPDKWLVIPSLSAIYSVMISGLPWASYVFQ